MRKNRIRQNKIKLDTEIRHRQTPNAIRIERTVVTIVVNKMRVGECFVPFFDRFTDHVETIIILMTDRARRIEQQVSLVATKIEHAFAPPVRTPELLIEVSKLRRLRELRTQCLLIRRSPPQMN